MMINCYFNTFVREGPRRAAKKVKGNCRKGKGRRSRATAIFFSGKGRDDD